MVYYSIVIIVVVIVGIVVVTAIAKAIVNLFMAIYGLLVFGNLGITRGIVSYKIFSEKIQFCADNYVLFVH